MNIITVKNGRAVLCKDTGTFIRYFGQQGEVVFADINADQSLVLITTSKGRAVLYKADTGTFVRGFGSNEVVQARFSGKDILLMTNKGKSELKDINGRLIRIF